MRTASSQVRGHVAREGERTQPTVRSARRRRVGVLLAALPLVLASCALNATPKSARREVTVSPNPTIATSQPLTQNLPGGKWVLTWSDNFSRPSSLRLWNYEVGGNGWGEQQLQYYTAANASVRNGSLRITAKKTTRKKCWYGRCQYTSARMNTAGIFAQKYGRFEARLKIPPGHGLWAAFWLESTKVLTGKCRSCGSVDILETNGLNPDNVQGYAHGRGHPMQQAYFTLPAPLASGYHTYGIDWSPAGISWFVDGHVYSHMASYPGWPFRHPFFLSLYLAVGGPWPGPPTATTHFPARMLVDWVRVYRKAA